MEKYRPVRPEDDILKREQDFVSVNIWRCPMLLLSARWAFLLEAEGDAS
ncbi:hypothetical protein [Mangrovibacterium lignilyticum]|nr:hypothetical protein [Mangrovibacterium lignilyticum]